MVGADSQLMFLFHVLVEVENDGPRFPRSGAAGCKLLSFTEPVLVQLENWGRQTWKNKKIKFSFKDHSILVKTIDC